ncbi:helix-turn-helix domain-containing GNAT family N-acetyltransferase [Roseibium alexandrii]|uniref:Transcriptional regulator n=1 Tax=Roseibium alexandrii (strain DSM 17067 / NCIMB 14079 / DFL-11) TaxID=244592 RepID=A0A5E8H2G7_ROSAD|nr:helix-turn-helix domain-containing GNAT family N-acetyltransferase [Roseibium alexandrii]EEE46719.1 Transcriptional regulator [Roseibium alexandrii DFL-11]
MTPQAPHLIEDIRAASRKLVREFGFLEKTIAGTDLSGSGVHAIIEIGLTPSLTAKELGARLKLEKSTISRLLKSLETRGEIVQTQSKTDGRAFQLHLTPKGKDTWMAINRFGDNQARTALANITGVDTATIANALTSYAQALGSDASKAAPDGTQYPVVEGYQTGMIGDISALHARTHGPIVGMGPAFERVVSQAMAEFMPRVYRPMNNSWSVLENEAVIGSITIDGEDLSNNIAHLRWFILSERLRGKGLGKVLLNKALAHCDRLGFNEIHLWTLKGLDAARALYEKNGFDLAEEYLGDQWGHEVMEQKFIRKRPA